MASNNDHNMKKKTIFAILLCLPVFYFLYFHASILVQSFDIVYFNDFSTKIFTYKTERNYVFLLFNGILVLIIRFSGLTGIIDQAEEVVKEVDHPIQEKKVKHVEPVQVEIHGEEEEDDLLKNEKEDPLLEDEELEELLSSEELNKKCEDFINKVKQEIRWQFQYLTPIN